MVSRRTFLLSTTGAAAMSVLRFKKQMGGFVVNLAGSG
jgi:hypothetical protein